MRQISKIHFTPKGELSNNFISLKKFELRTERPTKKKPTQMSGFLFFKVLFFHCISRAMYCFSHINRYSNISVGKS